MSLQDDSGEIADGIRALRVLNGQLVAGGFLFLLVVVASGPGVAVEKNDQWNPVTLVLLGQSVLAVLGGWILPRRNEAKRRRELGESLVAAGGPGEVSASDLMNMRRETSILRLALWVEAVFATLICTLVTGNRWPMLVAGAILVMMLWQWPTVPSVTRWVLEQRKLIRQEA